MKKLTLSSEDKKLAGVCGGIANYLGVDPTIVRIVAIVLGLAYCCGVLAYLVAWAIMPKEETKEEEV